MSTGDTLSIDLTDEMIMFPLCFLFFCLIMAYNSFSNKLSNISDDIVFFGGSLVKGVKAMLSGQKSTGLLLLTLGFGLSGCDKTFYDTCDYGKGTFSVHQTTNTVHRSPQGLIELPFVIQGSDIECGTALLKVQINVYDATTHKFIGTYTQQRNDFLDGTSQTLSFTANLPTNCRGVEGDIVVSTDEDPIVGEEQFEPKTTTPYKFDIN